MSAKTSAQNASKSNITANSKAAQKTTAKKQTPSKAKSVVTSTAKKTAKKSVSKKTAAKKSTVKTSVKKTTAKKTSVKSTKAQPNTPNPTTKKSSTLKNTVAKNTQSTSKSAANKKSIPKKTAPKKSPSKMPAMPKLTKGQKVVPTAPRVKVQEFPIAKWGANLVIHFEIAEQLPPPHLTSIAGGIVFHDNKTLLANVPGRGWEIIGGRIDLNEDPEVTFRREVELQLGVTLSHVKLLGLLRIEHIGPKPPNCPYPYPVAYGVQFLAIMDEMLPFKGNVDSLGRSLITMDGLSEHYYGWNDHHEAVFKYALEEYQKWAKKLKIK